MAGRLPRLHCSRPVLLSVLCVLGLYELGRGIGRYGESGQEQDHNILAVKEPLNNDQLVVKTKSDQKMTINVVDEDTEKAVNNTGLIKPKKIVRHKILLLAYARYPI